MSNSQIYIPLAIYNWLPFLSWCHQPPRGKRGRGILQKTNGHFLTFLGIELHNPRWSIIMDIRSSEMQVQWQEPRGYFNNSCMAYILWSYEHSSHFVYKKTKQQRSKLGILRCSTIESNPTWQQFPNPHPLRVLHVLILLGMKQSTGSPADRHPSHNNLLLQLIHI